MFNLDNISKSASQYIMREEYNVAKQNYRELYAKINLMDLKFNVLDSLEGVVVGEPSFSISSDSDIRRTCNISLIPKDSSFDIKEGGKIWLDKMIKIYIGIKDLITNEIIYTIWEYILLMNQIKHILLLTTR